ncbi:MAG: Holliday junction resolvase RuvX [Alistipes sp.]|uniref:Holliday junction resolvase RuvX n=1 Tax=Alistipes sp. TaxID=1872444 RepID=UPI001B7BC997|nr:Holliday junction resolvase RuvX [Alistipes sp.]
MPRLIAIDYGTKRTGLAVTDPLGIIASPLETVETKQLERYLADYFKREDVAVIVVGYPRQMNGQPSETMRYIEPLIGRLRHAYPEKRVVAYDERFTSVLAQRTIRESGIGKMARRDKSLVDKVSAAIILQDYMASVGM